MSVSLFDHLQMILDARDVGPQELVVSYAARMWFYRVYCECIARTTPSVQMDPDQPLQFAGVPLMLDETLSGTVFRFDP